MSEWVLLAPQNLWLLAALPLLAWTRPRHAQGGQRILAFVALLGVGVAWLLWSLSAACPAQRELLPDLATAILLDRSASIQGRRWDQALEQAQRYMAELERKPIVVVAAQAPKLVSSLRQARAIPAAPPEAGSSVRGALDLAVAAMPKAGTRRLLWITDGATGVEPGSESDRVFAAVRGAEVEVHGVLVDAGAPWTALWSARAQQDKQQGDMISVVVKVSGSPAGLRDLQLEGWSGGAWKPLLAKKVEVEGPEPLEVKMEFPAPSPGLHKLRVRVPPDLLPWDDELEFLLRVAPEPRVLLVGDPGLFRGVLEGMGWRSESTTLDRALRSWTEGDRLLLLDPSFEALGTEASQALADAVDQGLGLLLVGGPSELAIPEEEKDHPARSLLPVIIPDKKKKEPAPLAVVFCIDRSDSMGREQKLDLALASVAHAIGALPAEAEVAVLAYNDTPDLVLPLQRVGDNQAFARVLSRVRVSGGTSMFPALSEAGDLLQGTDAMLRHVIALTDGRSITNLARQGSVLDKLQAGRATVSVVGLGSDVDQEELLAIAQRGGGRAWFPKSLDDLPAILLDETVERVRENALTEEVEVYPVAGSLFVEGVDTLPPLQGRVRTESRPATEQGVVTEQGEPILASWRRGRGWVTVWASDAGARWATGAWADGSQKLLMERVVRGILSEQPSNLQLTARAAAHGVRLEFSVRDALGQARNDLLVEAVLLSTSGEGEAFVLPPVGAGRYGRLVEITGPSLIEVRAVGERKPRLGSGGLVPGGVALLSLSPPAPLEAHLGTLAEALTEQRVQSTGGRLNPAPQAFADAPRTREVLTERSSLFAFWGFLMWLAALLLRRLGLFHGVRPPAERGQPLPSPKRPAPSPQGSDGS